MLISILMSSDLYGGEISCHSRMLTILILFSGYLGLYSKCGLESCVLAFSRKDWPSWVANIPEGLLSCGPIVWDLDRRLMGLHRIYFGLSTLLIASERGTNSGHLIMLRFA